MYHNLLSIKHETSPRLFPPGCQPDVHLLDGVKLSLPTTLGTAVPFKGAYPPPGVYELKIPQFPRIPSIGFPGVIPEVPSNPYLFYRRPI